MAISITEALKCIAETIPTLGSETLPIEQATGRTSAEEIQATCNLPHFDNSAMDGYAINASDAGNRVEPIETIYAGDTTSHLSLQPHQAIKIMTGAPIPEGSNAIVPIENVTVEENQTAITLPKAIKPNDFIRKAGEDIAIGSTIITKGTELNAYHIATLASQGITHISVVKKITVAVFSTGDELKAHFETIQPHQLYNSNTPMLLARLQELGCTTHFIQTSADTPEALKNAIQSSLGADLIITSGGVSVGDKDFTQDAFLDLDMKSLFYKVNMKPGKPIAVGLINNTVVVNLPGNPLAAMVNFELYVRAILYKLSGKHAFHHTTIPVPLQENYKTKGGKYTVLLGHLASNGFTILPKQKPGMITPMSQTNALLLITPEVVEISKGTQVPVIPLYGNHTSNKEVDLFYHPTSL